MNIYTQEQTNNFENENFAFLQINIEDHVLHIILDRAEKKNALHPQMVNEIAFAMQYAHYTKSIWAICFSAKGNVFCAGADLKALAGFVEENDSTIPSPNTSILIGELFNTVYKPTVAKVSGHVFAGGFLILASCNIVVAQKGIRLALPEVKRGLYPFQVMAALLKVMPERKVIDWSIRGYDLITEEAEHYGLISQLVDANDLDAATDKIIEELKENSPLAISKGLEAYNKIRPSTDEHSYLLQMFQQTILSKDGQEGIQAFREKRKPIWQGE